MARRARKIPWYETPHSKCIASAIMGLGPLFHMFGWVTLSDVTLGLLAGVITPVLVWAMPNAKR